jgi:hypothetical protein
MKTFRSILLRMRIFSQIRVVEKIKTHYTFCNFFPENVEKYRTCRQATDDNIIRSLRTEYWKPEATNKHSEYVILIPLLRQQWLYERALMLRYTYTAHLVLKLSP